MPSCPYYILLPSLGFNFIPFNLLWRSMIELPVLRVMMSTMMTMVVLEMLIRQQHWKKNSEYLFKDAEQHTAMPDNDDEDWGSGSHQTQTSTRTADDDEGTEGHNYERVQWVFFPCCLNIKDLHFYDCSEKKCLAKLCNWLIYLILTFSKKWVCKSIW